MDSVFPGLNSEPSDDQRDSTLIRLNFLFFYLTDF